MRIQILILIILTSVSCTNNDSKNVKGKIEKFDSLSKEPVEEGFVPEHKIDFSHSIHSEQKLTSDCNYCHKKPNTKVELNLCASCHAVNLKPLNKLDYYVKLDSISTFVRKLKK